MLSAPDWLIEYLGEAAEQSERTGLEPKMAAMVRRTGLPADLISAAMLLAQLQPLIKGEAIDQTVIHAA